MSRIRSILWVGRGEGFGPGIVADAPEADVAWARDARDALALPTAAFDAIVVDAAGPEAATEALRELSGHALPPILVRMATAGGDPERLRALGAAEVLAPTGATVNGDARSGGRLLARLEAMLGRRAAEGGRVPARRESDPTPRIRAALRDIVGDSPALRELLALAERAAATQATVLIHGETGTGKELIARAIHRLGPRAGGPFLAVNCAAFPETLLESELFGHARGAFTGAEREKRGLFEAAAGGTLLLDEVGETSPGLQARLLRVLQEREVRPVGATRSRPIDVRLAAATNRDLADEVRAGRFRADLYYRLAVFPLAVPPLRARPEDVLPLARHFLARHGSRESRSGCRLAPEAEALLQVQEWPGNVRELENEIQRALALARPGEPLRPEHFSSRLHRGVEALELAVRDGESLRASLDRVEAWLIRRSLDAHGGQRTATARRLGLTREGLYKKMKRLGVE